MNIKYVYLFNEGNKDMRELLGGKGANLAEMTKLGIPVPQGFIITTEACSVFFNNGKTIDSKIKDEVNLNMEKLEKRTNKKFGDISNPLLLSVCISTRALMPGMMKTVLNLGMNDEIVESLGKIYNNPRWAWDCYRRFIYLYSVEVMELDEKIFKQLIEKMKEEVGAKHEIDFTEKDLKELTIQFKEKYREFIGRDFPQNPMEQLLEAIRAGFESWDNPRANVYRRDNDIPNAWGTAIIVMTMAFGNMGDDCGTGIAFTRNPSTGEKGLFGEFLVNSQGAEIFDGIRTPMQISEMQEKFPEQFEQLRNICTELEKSYRDMQDVEFIVEHGKLYILITRNSRRTAQAAIKIACDLVDEGLRTEEEAVNMINPRDIPSLLKPVFDPLTLKLKNPITKMIPCSPGAACGKLVFSAMDAGKMADSGEQLIMVINEHNFQDVIGISASQGVLVVNGGRTSRVAVMARAMGNCCVSCYDESKYDKDKKEITIGGKVFHEGDIISIDGVTGCIYDEAIPMVKPTPSDELTKIMQWADKYGISLNVEEEKTNNEPIREIEKEPVAKSNNVNRVKDYSSEDDNPIKSNESFFEKFKKLFK